MTYKDDKIKTMVKRFLICVKNIRKVTGNRDIIVKYLERDSIKENDISLKKWRIKHHSGKIERIKKRRLLLL